MDREERIELILDHYEHPRRAGRVPDADVVASAGNPGCGDIVTFSLHVDPVSERVLAIGLEGAGCTISQAGASMVAELIADKTLSEIEAVPHDAIIDIMGKDVAMTRPRCATLGLNTVRLAVRQFRRQRLMREHGLEEPATQGIVPLADEVEQEAFRRANPAPPRAGDLT